MDDSFDNGSIHDEDLVPLSEWARKHGIAKDEAAFWAFWNLIPTVLIGKRRMVNNALIREKLLGEDWNPRPLHELIGSQKKPWQPIQYLVCVKAGITPICTPASTYWRVRPPLKDRPGQWCADFNQPLHDKIFTYYHCIETVHLRELHTRPPTPRALHACLQHFLESADRLLKRAPTSPQH